MAIWLQETLATAGMVVFVGSVLVLASIGEAVF